MGHYVLGHVLKLTAVCSGLVLLAYYAAHLVAGPIITRFRTRFRFDAPSDLAALPLAVILSLVFAIAGLPVFLAYPSANVRIFHGSTVVRMVPSLSGASATLPPSKLVSVAAGAGKPSVSAAS